MLHLRSAGIDWITMSLLLVTAVVLAVLLTVSTAFLVRAHRRANTYGREGKRRGRR